MRISHRNLDQQGSSSYTGMRTNTRPEFSLLYLCLAQIRVSCNALTRMSAFIEVASRSSMDTGQLSMQAVTHATQCARLCTARSNCMAFSFSKSHNCVLYNSMNQSNIVLEEGSELYAKEV